jgi:NADPH:quinone reductase-like Zn-dependent oxidoreductase
MSPTNKAVWLPTKQAAKMEVKAAPYTAPGKNEIVVKSRAIALNPVDYMLQFMGPQMAGWIKYPFVRLLHSEVGRRDVYTNAST